MKPANIQSSTSEFEKQKMHSFYIFKTINNDNIKRQYQ